MTDKPDITKIELPWDWIGSQGTGQFPMTQSQYDWLCERGITRDEYLHEVARRKNT